MGLLFCLDVIMPVCVGVFPHLSVCFLLDTSLNNFQCKPGVESEHVGIMKCILHAYHVATAYSLCLIRN